MLGTVMLAGGPAVVAMVLVGRRRWKAKQQQQKTREALKMLSRTAASSSQEAPPAPPPQPTFRAAVEPTQVTYFDKPAAEAKSQATSLFARAQESLSQVMLARGEFTASSASKVVFAGVTDPFIPIRQAADEL
jgi:hypothetical protein